MLGKAGVVDKAGDYHNKARRAKTGGGHTDGTYDSIVGARTEHRREFVPSWASYA